MERADHELDRIGLCDVGREAVEAEREAGDRRHYAARRLIEEGIGGVVGAFLPLAGLELVRVDHVREDRRAEHRRVRAARAGQHDSDLHERDRARGEVEDHQVPDHPEGEADQPGRLLADPPRERNPDHERDERSAHVEHEDFADGVGRLEYVFVREGREHHRRTGAGVFDEDHDQEETGVLVAPHVSRHARDRLRLASSIPGGLAEEHDGDRDEHDRYDPRVDR